MQSKKKPLWKTVLLPSAETKAFMTFAYSQYLLSFNDSKEAFPNTQSKKALTYADYARKYKEIHGTKPKIVNKFNEELEGPGTSKRVCITKNLLEILSKSPVSAGMERYDRVKLGPTQPEKISPVICGHTQRTQGSLLREGLAAPKIDVQTEEPVVVRGKLILRLVKCDYVLKGAVETKNASKMEKQLLVLEANIKKSGQEKIIKRKLRV